MSSRILLFTRYSSLFILYSLLFTLGSWRLVLRSAFHSFLFALRSSFFTRTVRSSLLTCCVCLLQKRIQKQMRRISNRELSEERIKQINKIKRLVGITMRRKVAVKEAIALTVRKKLHQTKPNNRTLMRKRAVPKKMNLRLFQWKIIVSLKDLSVF